MESERLQRHHQGDTWMDDGTFSKRIKDLLNDPRINNCGLVDALYFDYSTLPEEIKDSIGRDAYLVFGITGKGEYISKWVDRWDLDSEDTIVDGKCIHPPYDPNKVRAIPSINQSFNKDLLTTPIPDFFKEFIR